MSKFKVGDKVRVKSDLSRKMYYMENRAYDCLFTHEMDRFLGRIVTICGIDENRYYISEDNMGFHWVDEMFVSVEAEQPRREFIVIRRSGAETIAELRYDREVIKSAKATCAPSDTFDLDTGAKLAFDRLMGREEPKPAPQPTHRFKVGERVMVDGEHEGEISAIDYNTNKAPYLVYCPTIGTHSGGMGGVYAKEEHNGKCTWTNESDLSPAPEPPKFYTGKVFAEKSTDDFFQKRDGHIFEFVDGYCKNATLDQYMGGRFNSFDEFCIKASCTKWHEVKSDV